MTPPKTKKSPHLVSGPQPKKKTRSLPTTQTKKKKKADDGETVCKNLHTLRQWEEYDTYYTEQQTTIQRAIDRVASIRSARDQTLFTAPDERMIEEYIALLQEYKAFLDDPQTAQKCRIEAEAMMKQATHGYRIVSVLHRTLDRHPTRTKIADIGFCMVARIKTALFSATNDKLKEVLPFVQQTYACAVEIGALFVCETQVGPCDKAESFRLAKKELISTLKSICHFGGLDVCGRVYSLGDVGFYSDS